MKSFPAIDRAREAARKRLGIAAGRPSPSLSPFPVKVEARRTFEDAVAADADDDDDDLGGDDENVGISVNTSMPSMASSLNAWTSKMDALFKESTAFIEETNGASRGLLARAVESVAIASRKEERRGVEEGGEEEETREDPGLNTAQLDPGEKDGLVGEEEKVEREEEVVEEEGGGGLVPSRVVAVKAMGDDGEEGSQEEVRQRGDRRSMDDIGTPPPPPPLASEDDVVDSNSSPICYRNGYDALPNVLEERGKHAFAKEWNCLKVKHRSFQYWSTQSLT
jgi:hypothetical protein